MRKVVSLAVLLPMFAWAQSSFDGTWRLHASHAEFTVNRETFALRNGTYTCSTCKPKIAVKADGTDQKTPGAKGYDTLSVKQVNDKTVEVTRKKDGKVVSESTDTVSVDGKTLTSEFKEYSREGSPVAGKLMWTRVGPGTPGSHAISGSWREMKIEDVSEDALVFTLKGTPDGLIMNSGTGESYEAKFDGKEYPVKGGHSDRTVSLRKVDDTTIEEAFKQEGKPFSVSRMTVTGNTLTFVSQYPRHKTTTSFTAERQQP
jgi:hypothetical protein